MSVLRGLLTGLVVGLLTLAIASSGAAVSEAPSADESGPTPAELVRIVKRLQTDPVYLAPDADLLGSAQQQLRDAVERARKPVYVVALSEPGWTMLASEVADRLDAGLTKVLGAGQRPDPQRAVLVYLGDQQLPAYGVFDTPDNEDADFAELVVEDSATLGPQERFVDLVTLVADRGGVAAYERLSAEIWDPEPEQGEDDEASDPGKTRWVVIGVVGTLGGLFVWLRGRAVAGWWARRRRARRLETYVDDAREVRDRNTAQRRLLALGEALDAAEMAEHHSELPWQEALDHYALAGRIADQRRDESDDIGVIVLCDLGQRHLAAALGGHFELASRCFVDPLHGPGSRRGVVEGTRVSLCELCARTRPERRSPLLVGGVPWYRTGRGPWVASGYGGLLPLKFAVSTWLARQGAGTR